MKASKIKILAIDKDRRGSHYDRCYFRNEDNEYVFCFRYELEK